MSGAAKVGPIRIGLVADEPIRVAGLASIFELPAEEGKPQFVPIMGSISELLSGKASGHRASGYPVPGYIVPEYIVIDLNSSTGFEALETIHRARPEIRLIVIGSQGDDELVMNSIIAGARAYLEPTAGPEIVRHAIEVVTEGSIWAPRRLLSQLIDRLIDRLLKSPDTGLTPNPTLTVRERQVLELIMSARSNREIATALGIEERTVKAYVGRLMRKTGADNRIKLSMSAMNLSIFPQDRSSSPVEAHPPLPITKD
jgi:DNA-binding NarL/FixJ family response regulator